MKYLGYILIAWGVADFGLSFMEIDLWGEIGIILPDAIWSYSAYIAIAIGYALVKFDNKNESPEEVTEQES
ncbi:MAG: hypothetical protein JKY60_16065 [Kordiimonadaceae bacterium]|nr:hypothetical protein [Kordiimonadaceae bacterium]